MAHDIVRAWSRLEIKSFDDNTRRFEGIATTPSTDRMGDIVEPRGGSYKLPLPFLKAHKSDQPIGLITEARVTRDGIFVKGHVEQTDAPPSLKERFDVAWAEMKLRLIGGLSIGFQPTEKEPINSKEPWGAQRFKKWDWMELSLVTIPANSDATIQTIKSLDEPQLRAALGASGSNRSTFLPGASGKPLETPKGTQMETVSGKLTELETKRTEMFARMEELATKANGDFSTLEDDESSEHDRIAFTDLPKVDLDIKRWKAHEANAAGATPVTPASGKSQEGAAAQRQGRVTWGKSNLPKGTAFTRYCMALMASKGDTMRAIGYAKSAGWKDSSPEVLNLLEMPDMPHMITKAAVDIGTTIADTGNSTWAAPLVQYNVMASEFIDLLRPATVIGRIQGLRTVPFNVKIPRQTAGASAKWVGEGKGKPVSKLDFDTVTMLWNKIAVIAVMTEELVRFSTPSAEQLVRADLIAQIAKFMDEQFLDPSVSANPGVSPASITNGLTPVAGTGSTIAQVLADLAALWAKFDAAGLEPVAPVFIMRPRTARYLSTLINANSLPVFPSITPTGGTLQGAPVITSSSVVTNTGTQSTIILLDANEVLFADDGQVSVDASREASLEMNDDPQGGTATNLVSLWQMNLVGLKAERFVNWMLRREDVGVAYIDSVAY